jgi:hypothetical protein
MGNWKPEFFFKSEGKWYQNSVTFATQEEAHQNAYDKFCAWTMPDDYRAVEVDATENPVNYTYVDGQLKSVS